MAIRMKIDKVGRIVIPKELRERKKLNEKVELIEVEEGVLIRAVQETAQKTLDDLYKNKLEIKWNKASIGDLSEESLDEYWL